jgi:uncharacterized protein (UPF0548 family)
VTPLEKRRFSYAPTGATRPDEEMWTQRPAGFRRYERTVVLGRGDALWEATSSALLRWGVKTRSGFTVEPASTPVCPGADFWLVARSGPIVVREPVRIVAVVEQPDRRGFAYGTLEGHPVSGEEAFVVHRSADGEVSLTLRSLTRAPQGRWRLAFPAALVAQRWYRRRYLRALRGFS